MRKIEKGFDFLGYHYHAKGLSVEQKTQMRFVERAARLFEQEQGKPCDFPWLELYVKRWLRWASACLKPHRNRRLCAVNSDRSVIPELPTAS